MGSQRNFTTLGLAIQRLAECDYRIRGLGRKRKLQVVHFNLLKLCTPGTRFEQDLTEATDADASAEEPTAATPEIFGEDMELIDHEEQPAGDPPEPVEPRYPRRARRHPDMGPVVAH